MASANDPTTSLNKHQLKLLRYMLGQNGLSWDISSWTKTTYQNSSRLALKCAVLLAVWVLQHMLWCKPKLRGRPGIPTWLGWYHLCKFPFILILSTIQIRQDSHNGWPLCTSCLSISYPPPMTSYQRKCQGPFFQHNYDDFAIGSE